MIPKLWKYGKMSRDNARTPVQWNAQVNAGFTTGTPWLKVFHSDYKEIKTSGFRRKGSGFRIKLLSAN